MNTDRTAVTIQSNKIVSNDIKDNQALLEPSYRKNQTNFLSNLVKETLGKVASDTSGGDIGADFSFGPTNMSTPMLLVGAMSFSQNSSKET